MKDFLVAGEHVQRGGCGIALESLPCPWNQVAIFLKKYITYEGRYQIVYFSEFPLLSQILHGDLLNMPF